MSNTDGEKKTMREDQQDLFRELSQEQAEAEKALEKQEQVEKDGSQDESDE